MAIQERRLRQDLVPENLEVGEIVVDSETGRRRPAYESQIQAAERYFQPLYNALLETELLRRRLNRKLSILEESALPTIEKTYDVEGGMFLMPTEPIPYTVYLWDRVEGHEELSETGAHQPGEPILFRRPRLRATEAVEPTVEMEVVDYPDLSLEVVMGATALRLKDRYIRLRRMTVDPSRHLLGFIEDDPVIRVS